MGGAVEGVQRSHLSVVDFRVVDGAGAFVVLLVLGIDGDTGFILLTTGLVGLAAAPTAVPIALARMDGRMSVLLSVLLAVDG